MSCLTYTRDGKHRHSSAARKEENDKEEKRKERNRLVETRKTTREKRRETTGRPTAVAELPIVASHARTRNRMQPLPKATEP